MKSFSLLVALLLAGTLAFGQQKKNTAAKKSTGTSARKSSSGSAAGGWGVGLRLGTLTGLTVKKHMARSAFEFNLGSLYAYGYGYDDRFYRYRDKKNYQYVGYRRAGGLGLQARLMGQRPIKGVSGLEWYYGGGLQLRLDRSEYTYRQKVYYGNDEDDYRWETTTGRGRADVGIDGLIGLEYHMSQAPVSFFVDTNLYIELIHYPGWYNMQGGAGVRYRF